MGHVTEDGSWSEDRDDAYVRTLDEELRAQLGINTRQLSEIDKALRILETQVRVVRYIWMVLLSVIAYGTVLWLSLFFLPWAGPYSLLIKVAYPVSALVLGTGLYLCVERRNQFERDIDELQMLGTLQKEAISEAERVIFAGART